VTKDYYAKKLSAERLRKVYDVASPRVRQYLAEEIRFVLHRIEPGALVLELGCGYGRVLERLASGTKRIIGIDTSWESLKMAAEDGRRTFGLVQMNAVALGFAGGTFDLVACIQNGISAFKVSPLDLMREAVRVTRPGGRVLFSSYSEKFWPHRLEWFREQARQGLLGEIDEEATGHGVIVCKDGFRATTFSPDDFLDLASRLDLSADILEVDQSSLFCEIIRQGKELSHTEHAGITEEIGR
jgi:2-polyprenyl-6-hydroxyphenyl methylase/3-demethylubiquinone-9 3-methyltransferase